MREGKLQKKARQQEILRRLEECYPDARPALEYSTPFELLIAVMLSAQCTDVRVNMVTRELFKLYNTPEQFAKLEQEELLPMIKSCGLGPSKSKNIIATAKELVEKYGGEVPKDIETLQSLPGVGRKTANVVASVAFGVPAIAVDTHVFRVSNRTGLASAKDVTNTEKQLMEVIPREKWALAHHWLIWHGRKVCTARNPSCDTCALKDVCTFALMPEKEKAKKLVSKSQG
ncbi:MAG: endonuclease III [Christensenellales bacterium]|jgi:endonuclease-3